MLFSLYNKMAMVLRWEAYRFRRECLKYLIPNRTFFDVNVLHRYCITAKFKNQKQANSVAYSLKPLLSHSTLHSIRALSIPAGSRTAQKLVPEAAPQ